MDISGIQKEDTDKLLKTENQSKFKIMRTLNSNQITSRVKDTNGYIWNSKRRYR